MRKISKKPRKIYTEREFKSRILNLIKLANKRGNITIKMDDGTLMSLVGIEEYRRLINFQEFFAGLTNEDFSDEG